MLTSLREDRVLISGFRFDGHVVGTYYDKTSNRWIYEAWKDGKLIDRRYFPKHGDNAENLFARTCNNILTMHNVRKPPYLSSAHIPPGEVNLHKVRIFNPTKLRQFDLFGYYRKNRIRG
jgi:hypothetical protein